MYINGFNLRIGAARRLFGVQLFALATLATMATLLFALPAFGQESDSDGTRDGAVSLGSQSPDRGRQYFLNKSLDRAGGDEVDYYSFTTDARYELGLGVRDQSINLDSWLEDADGNVVIQSGPPVDPNKDQTIEWLKTTIAAGTYYIKVQAMEDGQTDYYLRFGLSIPPNSAPVFASSTYNFSIAEDAASGSAVGAVSATDDDDDDLSYTIESGNEDDKFAISDTGAITTAGELDHETDASYALTVQADDDNGGTATATVNVSVTDVAEEVASAVTGFTLVDASDQTVLATLSNNGSVELADPDGGSYAIRADVDGTASIGSVRLELSGAKTVSRTENVAPYSLYGDGGENALSGGSLPAGEYSLTATAYSGQRRGGDDLGALTVSFTISEANAAPVFASSTYNFSIAEDAAVGDALGAVSATDADEDDLSYTIESGDTDGKFAISSAGAITTAGELDHETDASYTLTVQADDDNGGTATATVNVSVTDVAEDVASAVTGFTLVDASDQTVLATLSDNDSVELTDPDGGAYAIRADVNTDVTIGSVRLDLSGAKTVSRTENVAPYSLYGDGGANALRGRSLPTGSYTLTATAYENGSLGGDVLGALTISFTISEANAAPVFASSTYNFSIAEDATVGDAVGTVSATDADEDDLSYTIESGNEDGKFAISSAGAITTAGELDHETDASYTLTVQADDSNGGTATATVNVTVAEEDEDSGPVAPSLTTLTAGHDRVQVNWLVSTQPDTVTVDTMELLRDGLVVATVDWQRGVTAYSYEDTDVISEATYAYQVRLTIGEESLLSAAKSATTAAAPNDQPKQPLMLSLNDRDSTIGGATLLNAAAEEEEDSASGAMGGVFGKEGMFVVQFDSDGPTGAADTTTVSDSLDSSQGDFGDTYEVVLEDTYDEHTLGVTVSGLSASITLKITNGSGAVVAEATNGEAATVTTGTLTLPYGTYSIELRLAEDASTTYSLSYVLDALDPWADERAEATFLTYHQPNGQMWDTQSVGYYKDSTVLPKVGYYTFRANGERAVRLGARNIIANSGASNIEFNLTLEDSEGRTLYRSRNQGHIAEWIVAIVDSGTYYARIDIANFDERCLEHDFYLANRGWGGICNHATLMVVLKTSPAPEDPDKSPDIEVSYELPVNEAPELLTPPDDPQADQRFSPIESQHTVDYTRLTWELPDLGENVSVSRYTLQRNEEGDGGPWSDLHSSDTPFTAYTDRTVQPHGYYYYRLKLATSDGEIRSPAYVSANPTFVTVGQAHIKAIGKDYVTVGWHPLRDVNAIDGYRIYEDYEVIATVGPDQTEYKHESLLRPSSYSYHVKPFGDGGRGLWGYRAAAFVTDHPDLREKWDGRFQGTPGTPPGVMTLVFDETKGGDLWLRWILSLHSSTPTGFQIRRTMWGGGHGTLSTVIIDVPGKHTGNYIDREFRNGMVQYEVRAINEHGVGPWEKSTCYPEGSLRYMNHSGSQYDPDAD